MMMMNSSNANNPFTILPDDLVVFIFKFVDPKELTEVAVLVSQQFQRCVEKFFKALLALLEENNRVDDDFWFRLGQHYQAHNNQNISLSTLLTPPARILWKVAHLIHTRQFITRHCNCACVLPDGSIAMINGLRNSDGLIRIFDPNTFQISVCEKRQGTNRELQSAIRGGVRQIFYSSNGYLVISTNSGFSVWELQYDDTKKRIHDIRFSHQIRVDSDGTHLSYVDKIGKAYILHQRPGQQHQQIEVYAIATGNHIYTKLCNGMPECKGILLSGTHLLLVRLQEGGDGDGIYAFNSENGTQTSSLSGQNIQLLFGRTCLHTNYLLYQDLVDYAIRVISIDDTGILRIVRRQDETTMDIPLGLRQDGGIIRGVRGDLEYFAPSASRVFITDYNEDLLDEGNILKFQEFLYTSDRKARTLLTGLESTLQSHSCIEHILCNDTAVFCIIHLDDDDYAIQSFLV